MRSFSFGSLIVCVAAFAASAAAQTPPAAPAAPPAATGRAVVAATKLTVLGDAALHFKVVNVTIPAGASSSVATTNGIVYQLSGSSKIAAGGEFKTLSPGEGMFIAGGNLATVKAGAEGPSTFLHFLLASAEDLDHFVATPPAAMQMLYRTTAPLPDLKPGRYDLTLTRVTFSAQMASNPPHHRSGAALYYVISGAGANTIDGKVEAKPAGSLIYEPFGLVHQWGNPGSEPFTFVAFNLNPEGVAAVLPGAPAKSQ
jgi:quercetin dioxygenase-like cupin family protein